MIIGEMVGLRAIEKRDLIQLLEWRNHSELRRYFREYRELNADDQMHWYEDVVCGSNETLMFGIVSDKGKGILIGCCGLCYINWVYRNAEMSLYIGYDNSYIDDSGLAEDACKELLNYGFNELALHKISVEIYDFDIQKYRLCSSLGFEQDGLLRDNYFHEGKWVNSLILSIIEDQWSTYNADNQESGI